MRLSKRTMSPMSPPKITDYAELEGCYFNDKLDVHFAFHI